MHKKVASGKKRILIHMVWLYPLGKTGILLVSYLFRTVCIILYARICASKKKRKKSTDQKSYITSTGQRESLFTDLTPHVVNISLITSKSTRFKIQIQNDPRASFLKDATMSENGSRRILRPWRLEAVGQACGGARQPVRQINVSRTTPTKGHNKRQGDTTTRAETLPRCSAERLFTCSMCSRTQVRLWLLVQRFIAKTILVSDEEGARLELKLKQNIKLNKKKTS